MTRTTTNIKGMVEITTFATLNTHKVSIKSSPRGWVSNKAMVSRKSEAWWVQPSPQSSRLVALPPCRIWGKETSLLPTPNLSSKRNVAGTPTPNQIPPSHTSASNVSIMETTTTMARALVMRTRGKKRMRMRMPHFSPSQMFSNKRHPKVHNRI